MITYDIITTNKATGEQRRHLVDANNLSIVDSRMNGAEYSINLMGAYRTLYTVRKGAFTDLIEPTHWYKLSFSRIDDAIDYLIREKLVPENSFYYEDDIKDGETMLPIWCTLDGEDEFTGYTIDFNRLVEDIDSIQNSEVMEDVEYWRE